MGDEKLQELETRIEKLENSTFGQLETLRNSLNSVDGKIEELSDNVLKALQGDQFTQTEGVIDQVKKNSTFRRNYSGLLKEVEANTEHRKTVETFSRIPGIIQTATGMSAAAIIAIVITYLSNK